MFNLNLTRIVKFNFATLIVYAIMLSEFNSVAEAFCATLEGALVDVVRAEMHFLKMPY
jgi:hypothetical protein